MLRVSTRNLLAPASRSVSRLGAVCVRGAGSDVKSEESSGNTYDDFKRAAQKAGDAAEEWMAGARSKGHHLAETAKETAESAFEATKRAAAEVTASSRDTAARMGQGMRAVQKMADPEAAAVPEYDDAGFMDKANEAASSAAEAASSSFEKAKETPGKDKGTNPQ